MRTWKKAKKNCFVEKKKTIQKHKRYDTRVQDAHTIRRSLPIHLVFLDFAFLMFNTRFSFNEINFRWVWKWKWYEAACSKHQGHLKYTQTFNNRLNRFLHFYNRADECHTVFGKYVWKGTHTHTFTKRKEKKLWLLWSLCEKLKIVEKKNTKHPSREERDCVKEKKEPRPDEQTDEDAREKERERATREVMGYFTSNSISVWWPPNNAI